MEILKDFIPAIVTVLTVTVYLERRLTRLETKVDLLLNFWEKVVGKNTEN